MGLIFWITGSSIVTFLVTKIMTKKNPTIFDSKQTLSYSFEYGAAFETTMLQDFKGRLKREKKLHLIKDQVIINSSFFAMFTPDEKRDEYFLEFGKIRKYLELSQTSMKDMIFRVGTPGVMGALLGKGLLCGHVKKDDPVHKHVFDLINNGSKHG